MQPGYLSIEGNIGTGKSTLSHMLAREWNAQLILEQFEDNSFLPKFYSDPKRYAFPLEMSFLTSRYKQLDEQLASGDLFRSSVVADYGLFKSLVFARVTLNEDEYHLYLKLYDIVSGQLRQPDKVVYLHRPVDQLLKQIAKRGRAYEQNMEAGYLRQVQEGYLQYFRQGARQPVLILEMGALDFEQDPHLYRQIKREIQQEQKEAVRVVSMV